MEALIKFLPLIAQLMSSPEIARLLPQILKSAGGLFPNVPPELQPQAAATAMDANAVKWIQTALKLLGAGIESDGRYGAATKVAVEKFQREHGLEVDGWAGDVTQERLRLAVLQGAG